MKNLMITLILLMPLVYAEENQDQTVDIEKMFSQIKGEMQDEIRQAKKCAAIASRVCQEQSLQDCMKNQANAFPSHCREQIAIVTSTQQDVMKTMKPCLDKAMSSCSMPKDLSDEKSMINYRKCMEKAMKSDATCTELMEKKAQELSKPENKTDDPYKSFIK